MAIKCGLHFFYNPYFETVSFNHCLVLYVQDASRFSFNSWAAHGCELSVWSSVICHLVWCISTKPHTMLSQYMNIHIMCWCLSRIELYLSVLVILPLVNIYEYLLVLIKTDGLKVCHPCCVNIICNIKETASQYTTLYYSKYS